MYQRIRCMHHKLYDTTIDNCDYKKKMIINNL